MAHADRRLRAVLRREGIDRLELAALLRNHAVDDAVGCLSPLTTLCVTERDDTTCICGSLADVPGVAFARVPGTRHFENGIPDVIHAAMRRLFTTTSEVP